jgi:hypothetical protein
VRVCDSVCEETPLDAQEGGTSRQKGSFIVWGPVRAISHYIPWETAIAHTLVEIIIVAGGGTLVKVSDSAIKIYVFPICFSM